MPVTLYRDQLPLTTAEVNQLWTAVCRVQNFLDAEVGLRCVSLAEIQRLNATYRHKDKPTNVLTFSYGDEHDVALCLEVAEREAKERQLSLRDYCALLLTHAFLHATGLDHEVSPEAATQMEEKEAEILAQAGFARSSL